MEDKQMREKELRSRIWGSLRNVTYFRLCCVCRFLRSLLSRLQSSICSFSRANDSVICYCPDVLNNTSISLSIKQGLSSKNTRLGQGSHVRICVLSKAEKDCFSYSNGRKNGEGREKKYKPLLGHLNSTKHLTFQAAANFFNIVKTVSTSHI